MSETAKDELQRGKGTLFCSVWQTVWKKTASLIWFSGLLAPPCSRKAQTSRLTSFSVGEDQGVGAAACHLDHPGLQRLFEGQRHRRRFQNVMVAVICGGTAATQDFKETRSLCAFGESAEVPLKTRRDNYSFPMEPLTGKTSSETSSLK